MIYLYPLCSPCYTWTSLPRLFQMTNQIRSLLRVPGVAAIAFLAILSRAQAAPNFTGEWKLDIALSDFGSLPAPQIMTRSIQHNDPSLQIKTHQKSGQNEATTELVYTTDGRECVNKIQGSEARGTAKWQADRLVIESVRDIQGTPVKSVETWTLSSDGRMLTIVNQVKLPQQEISIKFVFDKQ